MKSPLGNLSFVLMLMVVAQGTTPGFATTQDTVVLFSGEHVVGEITELSDDRLQIGGRSVAYHELQEIDFGKSAGEAPDLDSMIVRRPFLQFVSGEVLFARVEKSNDKILEVLVRGAQTDAQPSGEEIGTVRLALAAVRAFRMREAHSSDDNFESNLVDVSEGNDCLFVRKGDRLLRVEGLFAGIDGENVGFEYRDKKQQLRRNRVQGVILSRVAGGELESGYRGTLWLEGGGRMPVVLRGIEKSPNNVAPPRLRVTVFGEPWSVELFRVRRVTFDSRRLVFLSDLDPAAVEEVGLFDEAFPYRRDRSVGGETIQYDGVEYPKGIGVHSRTTLEYVLAEEFTSFSARVAIQSTLENKGDATVRVVGDGRSLFKTRVHGDRAVEVLVSVQGIKRFRLETDFGDDGVNMGDHVNWIGARLIRPAEPAATRGSEAKKGGEE